VTLSLAVALAANGVGGMAVEGGLGPALTLAIAEASLELVPKRLWRHPAVWRNARRRGKKPKHTLLDISLHYAAMKERLEGWERRGRPDITHFILLHALGSPLSKRGLLRVYVHTIANAVIDVKPGTRIPKNYMRFVGLMEQLLVMGRVPQEGEPLLEVVGTGFEDVMKRVKPTYVVLLSERGSKVRPMELARRLAEHERPLAIVGGFPRGDFSPCFYQVANEVASLYPEPLEAWVASSILIHAYEEVLGLYST